MVCVAVLASDFRGCQIQLLQWNTDYESQKWNKVPKRALVVLGFGRDLLHDTGQFTSGISFASCRYFFTLELCSAWTGLAPALVPAGFLKWGFGHPEGQMAPPQTAHKAGSHCPPAENPHRSLQLHNRRVPCFQGYSTKIPKLPLFNDSQFAQLTIIWTWVSILAHLSKAQFV